MKKKVIKTIVFLSLFSFSFIYTIRFLDDVKMELDDETLLLLLESSSNVKNENRVVNKLVKTIRESELVNPITFLDLDIDKKDIKEEVLPVIQEEIKPIVYIYNTHQKESYSSSKDISINYSVMDASIYLQEKLKSKGILSIVENNSVSDVLNINNWNYASSYKVSRMFLEQAKKDNPTLAYYIDIHRDSGCRTRPMKP